MSLIMLGPTTTEPAPFRGTRSASASTSLPCALPQVASPPDVLGTLFAGKPVTCPECTGSAPGGRLPYRGSVTEINSAGPGPAGRRPITDAESRVASRGWWDADADD